MKKTMRRLLIFCLAVLLFGGVWAGPLPEFTYGGISLDPADLNWCPALELEHPSFIKVEGLIDNPLGKYYLYYANHGHYGVGLAYSDSMRGPWIEYEGNPVVTKLCAAPDVRWVVDDQGVGKFFLWAHSNNSYTELWTSEDGIHFKYQGIKIEAARIGTKNSTYTRMYEYPIERNGTTYKYIMLYVGYYRDTSEQYPEKRCLFLAYSQDAISWIQETDPIVVPSAGEVDALYDPSMLQWEGTNYIVYAENDVWRGGTLKYVAVDEQFNSVGTNGTRHVLIGGTPELEGRWRSQEFLIEGDTIHMIAGGDYQPYRKVVYAYAKLPSKTNSPDYNNWTAAHGLAAADADLDADPDGDGRPNMEEFAFDGNPTNSVDESKRVLTLVDVDGSPYYSLTMPVRTPAKFARSSELLSVGSLIDYRIAGSTNLSETWDKNVVEMFSAETNGLPALNSGWGYRTFRIDLPAASLSQAFVKIEASESDPTTNEPPTFNQPITAAIAAASASYNDNIADWAFDWDGDPMTFSLVTTGTWLNVTANGDLNGTPGPSDLGTNSFTVQVDAVDGSDTETLTIFVTTNRPPAFSNELITRADAIEAVNYNGSSITATDPDGDPLTYSLVATNGTSWLSVAANGTLSGIPGALDLGTNVFTVRVDSQGGSDTATLQIFVKANNPPSFSGPIAGVPANLNASYSDTVAGQASDVDGDALTYSLETTSTWLNVAANGDLSGIPGPSDAGTNTFTVRVDAVGGSDTETLTIFVSSNYIPTEITADFARSSSGKVVPSAALNIHAGVPYTSTAFLPNGGRLFNNQGVVYSGMALNNLDNNFFAEIRAYDSFTVSTWTKGAVGQISNTDVNYWGPDNVTSGFEVGEAFVVTIDLTPSDSTLNQAPNVTDLSGTWQPTIAGIGFTSASTFRVAHYDGSTVTEIFDGTTFTETTLQDGDEIAVYSITSVSDGVFDMTFGCAAP